jgi:hypothetical protein
MATIAATAVPLGPRSTSEAQPRQAFSCTILMWAPNGVAQPHIGAVGLLDRLLRELDALLPAASGRSFGSPSREPNRETGGPFRDELPDLPGCRLIHRLRARFFEQDVAT